LNPFDAAKFPYFPRYKAAIYELCFLVLCVRFAI